MRKQMMRKIVKELKKDNLVGVSFMPTLEECYYLYEKNNVISLKSFSKRNSFVNNFNYFIDSTDFLKEN